MPGPWEAQGHVFGHASGHVPEQPYSIVTSTETRSAAARRSQAVTQRSSPRWSSTFARPHRNGPGSTPRWEPSRLDSPAIAAPPNHPRLRPAAAALRRRRGPDSGGRRSRRAPLLVPHLGRRAEADEPDHREEARPSSCSTIRSSIRPGPDIIPPSIDVRSPVEVNSWRMRRPTCGSKNASICSCAPRKTPARACAPRVSVVNSPGSPAVDPDVPSHPRPAHPSSLVGSMPAIRNCMPPKTKRAQRAAAPGRRPLRQLPQRDLAQQLEVCIQQVRRRGVELRQRAAKQLRLRQARPTDLDVVGHCEGQRAGASTRSSPMAAAAACTLAPSSFASGPPHNTRPCAPAGPPRKAAPALPRAFRRTPPDRERPRRRSAERAHHCTSIRTGAPLAPSGSSPSRVRPMRSRRCRDEPTACRRRRTTRKHRPQVEPLPCAGLLRFAMSANLLFTCSLCTSQSEAATLARRRARRPRSGP